MPNTNLPEDKEDISDTIHNADSFNAGLPKDNIESEQGDMNETNKSKNFYNDNNNELEDFIENYEDQKINEEINCKDTSNFINEKVTYVLFILLYKKGSKSGRCRPACWIDSK